MRFSNNKRTLELVCCKKQTAKNSLRRVTGLRNRGTMKDLNDSKLIVYETKWFPWSSRINFIPFRIFRGPLFCKLVTSLFLTANRLYRRECLSLIRVKNKESPKMAKKPRKNKKVLKMFVNLLRPFGFKMIT